MEPPASSDLPRVPPDVLRQNQSKILQWISLPDLLPVLQENKEFSTEEIGRLKETQHSVIERTGYLLQSIYKRGQAGVDVFLQCLREETKHSGHREILKLLEAPDKPAPSPVLDILDAQVNTIESYLSLAPFLSSLLNSGAISVHTYMDVTLPHRTQRENLARLLKAVQEQGVGTFIKLVECLQKDSTPAHQKLSELLLEEVKTFLKESPQRHQVSASDKIALKQLIVSKALAGRSFELEMATKFKQHSAKLQEELKLSTLLPYLSKYKVLSAEEVEQINGHEPALRSKVVLEMVAKKGTAGIIGFVDCLKESDDHKKLGELFDPGKPSAANLSSKKPAGGAEVSTEKYDKLAVMICMDKFVELNEEYIPMEQSMAKFNQHFEEDREKLQTCLERLKFHVVQFGAILAGEVEEEEVNGDITAKITELFHKYVLSKCSNDAVVFIYVSGIQFPHKINRSKEKQFLKRDIYNGAILLHGASEASRKPLESIRAQDLHHWVELLPTPFITILIDSHQSHVVAYGKQRQLVEVEIMEDPWKNLISFHSSVVLYFVKPDLTAMQRQHGQESSKKSVFGVLTNHFSQALMAWIRRTQPGVSHRLFYEAISFHWYKTGGAHLLYNPAVQGDVDRVFIGKLASPYHQIFRADLCRLPEAKQPEIFNLKELQVPTGTMAGLIRGDELEVFHVLYPEVKVGGRITKANQLSSTAEIRDKGLEKLSTILYNVYSGKERDSCTEFLFLKKKFPLHQREAYAVFLDGTGENDAETIKAYIRESSMLLSVALKSENARMVVRRENQLYVVEDKGDDVCRVEVKGIHRVKTMLEMMAWYKYVKGLKQQQKVSQLSTHTCHMTSEKPLLSRATPLDRQFQLRCSSHRAPYPLTDAVLQFSDQPKFWIPYPISSQPNYPYTDPRPLLEVEFRENHILTAIETRGDPYEDKFVDLALLRYQKRVPIQDRWSGPTKDKKSQTIELPSQELEPVQYITIRPNEWEGETFALNMKIKCLISREKGYEHCDVEGLTVRNLRNFQHQHGALPWTFSPPPDVSGSIKLDSPYHWLTCRGSGPEAVTFDLGVPLLLERIELTAVPDANPLETFWLELKSNWLSYNLPPVPSVWPMKHQFPRPLVLSTLQYIPKQITGTEIKVQIQLYGNKHGETLRVEERDILTLHFTNFSNTQLFLYIFCLEETGMVKLISMEVVERRTEESPSSCKKLIRTTIPEGYDPPTKQITDLYKVFVSPKKMYLEPFVQRGLPDYHQACSYSVCSYGPRTDWGSRDEQWFEYQFKVVVKKASRRP